MILYSLVWPCMVLYGRLLSCIALYGPVDQYCPAQSGMVQNVQQGTTWSGMFPNGHVCSSMDYYCLVWLCIVQYDSMPDLENLSHESTNQHIYSNSNTYACFCSTHATFAQTLCMF